MRRISLASRFVVTLVVTAVLPLLVYGWFSLRSMREQIDEQVVRVFLPQLAADHAQKIDALLQRTDQACAIVREIARRALDSPAEMAAFEEQIELVPDLLDNSLDLLLLADASGRVAYWQDGQRLDPSSHGRRAALIPTSVADADWFRRSQTERTVQFLPWGRSPYLHRGLDHRSMDPGSHHLGLAVDVPRPSGPPGVLFALLRWTGVQLVLDQAREVLAARAGLPSAQVLLASRDGIVLAHTDRARYGLALEPPALAQQVAGAAAMGRGVFAATDGAPWRVGFARSLVASRAIVAPVRALVAATRRVAGGDLTVSVPARGGPELGELAGAFNQMAAELAQGRARLVAAEREQAWAEMARQVAHEVKNPLQPMRMAAQLLQRARAERDPRAEAVADRLARTVLEQTQALDRIASDFRAFAGVAPAQRTPVRLDDWLHELHEQCTGLFAGKALRLQLVVGAGSAQVSLDRRAFARVFVNLLQNALEAAPAGVAVTITSRREGERAVVEVADDGPGLTDAARQRLFEPYFTTKSSGTGLGLAICRRLVEAHGGAIRLAGSRAGATVFAIELPVVAA